MTIIRLPHGEWNVDFDSQIGPKGGFGIVFVGEGKGYSGLAIKRLNITAEDSANRELRVADRLMGDNYKNIIPIYDAGQDAETEYYYIVMAKAERSLKDEIDARGKIPEAEVVEILLQIVLGLSEVNDIIHRDLKPGNVLFHEGAWKLSDFGIAKFVEESTSLQTLKDCLSPQYAAPEQWRLESASSATDLYALGCVAYHLLVGQAPFSGYDFSDYQKHHLFSEVKPVDAKNPLLRSLVSMLMRKLPEARPTLERVRSILQRISNSQNDIVADNGLSSIALAGAIEAERISASEAQRLVEQEQQKWRAELAKEANKILQSYRDSFFLRLTEVAPVVDKVSTSIMALGSATLEIQYLQRGFAFPKDSFSKSQWDVICGAFIKVKQDAPAYSWSASLWYTNQGVGTTYNWVEVSYWQLQGDDRNTPFALIDIHAADLAHSKVSSIFNIASKPRVLDELEIEGFIARWSNILAKAHKGELRYPSSLPLD